MEILRNNEEAFLVFAMQGEADISNIQFKIKLDDLKIDNSFDVKNLLTVIQFKDDYLTNIPDTNVNLEIKEEELVINWLISKAMTLEAKEREFQVIIKNKKTSEIFKSYKSIFKVQKSIDTDNEDCQCDTTCIAGMLEQWNIKMQQIIDTGGNVDLSEYAKLSEIAENYYNKEQIDAKVEPLITKQEVTTTLEPYSLKTEVDSKTENLQAKEDESLETTSKNIVGAINELKDTSDTINQTLANKADTSSLELKQNKNDNSLATTSKNVAEAINEVNELAKNNKPDLSNYYQKSETYNKSETDGKIDVKLDKTTYTADKSTFQLKQDNELATTAKTVVGAINELKSSIQGGGGSSGDLSDYYNKSQIDSKLGEKLNISNYNSDKSTFQTKEDSSLNTTAKTVSGAINELKNSSDTTNNELQNKANASDLNSKQDKNDQTLETSDKTIVGAINEVNTLAKNASGADLSNYYQKSETYNKSEIDNKLVEKLDINTYNTDKSTFQLKNDDSLETEAKTVSGAINELNTNKITLNSLSGVQGIDYSSDNGQISVKVDNKTIKVNESGNLESLGGGSNAFENSNKMATIGEALKVVYVSATTSNWTSGDFPYYKRNDKSMIDKGDLLLKIDKSTLDPSCSVLRVKPKISGLSTPYGGKSPSLYMYLITGGTYSYSSSGGIYTFTDTLSYETFARFTQDNYDDNNKETFIFIPNIEKNEIYIRLSASEDTAVTVESIEVVQVLNTQPNLLLYRKDQGWQVPFRMGNGSIYIGGGGIAELTNGGSNVSYGINTLRAANNVSEKYLSSTTAIGNNTATKLVEGNRNVFDGYNNCPEMLKGSYNTIVGSDNCNYTHTSTYPNYDYVKEMNNSTIIGYSVQTKTATPKNENIIGYYAKGNGDNTFTLGNNEITALYAQVSSITQFSDVRVKENIKDVDVDQVIANIKGLKVIHAGYQDLEEFIGSNENDRHKLMFDGASYRNSFENDTKLIDRIFHPIDPDTKKRKVASVMTLEEDGETVTKEIDETLVIENCIEITYNQLLPALVVTNQFLLGEVEKMKETIKQQNDLINRVLSRLEALENK